MSNRRDQNDLEFPFEVRASRREFLAYMGMLLAAAGCGSEKSNAGTPVPPAPPLATNPFLLGVASGDPLPESVILWTRLALDPIHDGNMPEVDVPVVWEVALDADFRDVVRDGWLYAQPAFAHSVHIDVDGLAPDSWYYYRMKVGDQWTSPTGRTRTLPATDASPDRFRVALASCQNYRDGYYNAHALIAQEEVDLVFFVGDYIYESGIGEDSIRQHDGPTPETLPAYRNRYGLYKSDPDLQAAHHAFPWVVTWDDHEVANNYAGLHLPDKTTDEVLARRRAAYQAYYEHQPLRISAPSDFGYTKIYRSFEVGDLANVHVLDTRQYRDDQPCNDQIGKACAEAQNPDRTMMGLEQKAWLKAGVQSVEKLWNLVVQQVVFMPIKFNRVVLNPDQWDGYQAERQEMLDLFTQLRNVVVLTGDIHAAGFGELKSVAANDASETIGYEVVGTSITSGGDLPLDQIFQLLLPQNPHIHYLNAGKRGYALCDFSRDKLRVEYHVVDTVQERNPSGTIDIAFEVDRATLGFVKIEG